MAGRSDFGVLVRMAALVLALVLFGDAVRAQSPLDEAEGRQFPRAQLTTPAIWRSNPAGAARSRVAGSRRR